jgi:hypothetical protein
VEEAPTTREIANQEKEKAMNKKENNNKQKKNQNRQEISKKDLKKIKGGALSGGGAGADKNLYRGNDND